MNPRYLAYCSAHGMTPEAMAEHDEVRWPGGRMAGFILWMSEQSRKFFKAHPEAFSKGWNGVPDPYQLSDHSAWDTWLQNQA